jgi:DNA helicase HerA-like ATPase
MADVKGDLSGLAAPGGDDARVRERVKKLGLADFRYEKSPVVFWDVFGEGGHPVRTTVSEMGPLLFGRILNLNEVQAGVLSVVFKVADDNGLLLLDLKDLRAMMQFAGDHAAELRTGYGNISPASIGAIHRNQLALQEAGGDRLFGEPALDLQDLMQTDGDGRGVINVLAADRLMRAPRTYATLLLWMLSELFEQLSEVGDPEKPRLVFFFDEAHLLFEDAPKVLVDRIEQVVRLIRSKGVGIYLVTQSPLDVPETVLGQLGNRVQHALRAFTPRDQKTVKAAAETFRANPGLDVARAVTELGVGEALVSVLDDTGTPTVVERAMIMPPHSRLAPLSAEERAAVVRGSSVYGHYERGIDRESAYEQLKARAEQSPASHLPQGPAARAEQRLEPAAGPAPAGRAAPRSQTEQLIGALAKSAAHAVGSQIGRQIIRGVLGSLFGGGRR